MEQSPLICHICWEEKQSGKKKPWIGPCEHVEIVIAAAKDPLESRIRELESERDAIQKRFELVSKNAAEFGIERDELLDRVKKLQAENERLTEIARKYKLLCEAVGGSDADCLPTCDSEFHDEKCPSVIPAEHIVNLQAHIERLKAELEQLTVQMAGVSVAALGGTKDPAKQGDYGWSVPYQDVLNLRLKYDELAKP